MEDEKIFKKRRVRKSEELGKIKKKTMEAKREERKRNFQYLMIKKE